MSWAIIAAVALVVFLVAAFVLHVGRGGWTLLGATLLFGLTGYAMQGSPDQPASPGTPETAQALNGELLVQARREFYPDSQLPSRWVVTGDGFLRRGAFEDAAGFYRNAALADPRDGEAWLAMGIALVEHAEGNLTPAALEAFERAQAVADTNGGPRYFLGLAWLRAREVDRARELWAEALARAPVDAPWVDTLGMRLMRLDQLTGAETAVNEPDRPGAEPEDQR